MDHGSSDLLANANGIEVGMLVFTGALAILTAVYVVLTHRIVQAQTDPCVIVYVEQNEVHPTLLDIVMENIGPGLALDIRFEFTGTIPSCTSEDKGKPIEHGPIIHGIPALPPRGKRMILWGNFPDIKRIVGDRRICILCYYRRSGRDFLNPELCPTECELDYKSFEQSMGESRFSKLEDKLTAATACLESVSSSLETLVNQQTRN